MDSGDFPIVKAYYIVKCGNEDLRHLLFENLKKHKYFSAVTFIKTFREVVLECTSEQEIEDILEELVENNYIEFNGTVYRLTLRANPQTHS
jgi:hypothetical protein